MEVSLLNDTKYTTSLDGEETARPSGLRALYERQKTRKGFPSSSLEDPFTPLSQSSDKLLQKLLLTKKENPQAYLLEGSPFENGGYLLSHFYAVPSAWLGLTSLFGMGRGGTPTL